MLQRRKAKELEKAYQVLEKEKKFKYMTLFKKK